MNQNIKMNAVNQFTKYMDIYAEGEEVQSVALVIKGRILVRNKGVQYIVPSGCFIGVHDLYRGKYQNRYTILDDGMLYIFPARKTEELEHILSANNAYGGLMVASHNRIIRELDTAYSEFRKKRTELAYFIQDKSRIYMELVSQTGHRREDVIKISEIPGIDEELEEERDRIDYYRESAGIPVDDVQNYYSHGQTVCLYQIKNQAEIIRLQTEVLIRCASEITGEMKKIIDNTDQCLFQRYTDLAIDMKRRGIRSSRDMMDYLDDMIEIINEIESLCEKRAGIQLAVDRARMEESYHLLLTGEMGGEESLIMAQETSSEDEEERIIRQTEGSFGRLLSYSGLSGEATGIMMETMDEFVRLEDRRSSDEGARAIRKRVAENHYILYKAIFLKAYHEGNEPDIVDFFLRYGYADERLLETSQLKELYSLKQEVPDSEEIKVYDIREWLTAIYEGKKLPSKNEFDEDYMDMLASMKRQGSHSDQEIRALVDNMERRLDYEIENLFRNNNKITNGQISTFVPVLHKDMMINYLKTSFIKKTILTDIVFDLMKIDYSVFDREVIYSDRDKNITKEYVIRRIYPDIILMPTVGMHGIMWQEITGKRRDTPGRFILPIFCEADLRNTMIKLFGRFRWEMCRTIEGMAWNDIKTKSLTSEYSDYLQFYKKNRELSEEKKERLKMQIQKGRNSREIFVIDYEQWINYESAGAIKLNKFVREIMVTYCPFARPIRERLIALPHFADPLANYNRHRQKKIKEIEGRHRLLQKDQVELTQELVDTLEYYQNN